MTTEIIYTHPDGREEVRYRRPSGSPEALAMEAEVMAKQAAYPDTPYSFRMVKE